MRKLNESEITGLIIFSMFIIFTVLLPIQYGMKLTASLVLNSLWLYVFCFIETIFAIDDEDNNEKTFASELSLFSAIAGITLFIAAMAIESL